MIIATNGEVKGVLAKSTTSTKVKNSNRKLVFINRDDFYVVDENTGDTHVVGKEFPTGSWKEVYEAPVVDTTSDNSAEEKTSTAKITSKSKTTKSYKKKSSSK